MPADQEFQPQTHLDKVVWELVKSAESGDRLSGERILDQLGGKLSAKREKAAVAKPADPVHELLDQKLSDAEIAEYQKSIDGSVEAPAIDGAESAV